jgi:hypothetical protein
VASEASSVPTKLLDKPAPISLVIFHELAMKGL